MLAQRYEFYVLSPLEHKIHIFSPPYNILYVPIYFHMQIFSAKSLYTKYHVQCTAGYCNGLVNMHAWSKFHLTLTYM